MIHDDELSDSNLKEQYTIHKTACKQANVKPMSWKKFVLNSIYSGV